MRRNENYIYTYYQKIKDGTENVGRFLMLWYELVIKGLETKKWFYDGTKAHKAIMFIENFCRHSEGVLGGQLVKLELWEKSMISILFGIMDASDNRQFREAFIVIARKNGKTLLAAAISAYCAYLDGEYGGKIYFAAPKLDQASLCFNALYQMILTEPALKDITKKRRTDLYVAESNTTMKPLAFNAKKSDGLNISLCIADEVACWHGDGGLKFYEVIKSSFGARKQPLLLSITTAGYESDGVYDELMMRATSLLNGNSSEQRLAPFLYIIDDVSKWNDINELRKSNPNLGVTITIDYLLEEIAIAESSLSKKAEFLTKYCNIKQNSSLAWLNEIYIKKCFNEVRNFDEFRNCYCVGGIDLSRTTDLTSACVVIEKDRKLYDFHEFWMPAEKVEELQAKDGVPYKIYIQQGVLHTSGDNFIDYHDCFNWFAMLVQKYKIFPLKVGYDRYCAQYLVQEMSAYGFNMDDVFQGFNLTGVINETEGLIRDGRFEFGTNNLLKRHLLDSGVKIDNELEKKRLIKTTEHCHIDGTAALLDAMCVRQKWYKEIGAQLINEGK